MENNELVTPHGLSFSGSIRAQRKEERRLTPASDSKNSTL